ncbi:MAG: hypothetical protein ACTSXO_08740 [Candidatus Heimdallarchaeota archaeon]|nr:MAG: hypothetical protein DRO63_00465 [Candidatus Gerdarchaeota archaeon]RLI72327.1 MAG: hypothetical protein DRP02_02090 [Candidatus Gerdarchaeota archaeon]
MNKAVYYKFMFIISGSLNILAALLFGIFALTLPDFFSYFGLQKPNGYIWYLTCLLFAAIMGFQYFLVGLDISKNHLVVSSGIFSKFASFFVALLFFILGSCNWVPLLLTGVNLVFGALFIEFFVNYKKLDTQEIMAAYSPLKKG